ncbi:tetratricopeptide repeat protein [Streptomyces sp. NPDC093094]|uniref:tetratricopeptide repeat protein n=1 Tax=Streptomyces sp. NPDC093094 TaxID=3366026 RepID=UPI00381E9F9A
MARRPRRKNRADTSTAPAVPVDGGGAPPPEPPGAAGTRQEVFHSGNVTVTGGGTGVSGIYAPTVNLPPEALRPPAEVDTRPGLDDPLLPHQPKLFVGRGRELDRLDAALAAPGVALVQAVHGLGGIGKSTLAAHWAATRPHGHTPIRWITADSPAAVRQGLASLAIALQPALDKALTTEALTEWGAQWLASHTGWLIVLDNVNDPADIAPLIARARGGRFLITSRHATGWNRRVTLIGLDVLPRTDSVALLNAWEPFSSLEEEWHARQLAKELGDLPLALEQAAAYMAQTVTSIQFYRDSLAEQLDEAAQDHSGEEQTVARVWKLTLATLEETDPLAVELLHVMAWLDPDSCPRSLLAPLAPGKLPVASALGRLNAFSMITLTHETVSVHCLVQTVVRDGAVRRAGREADEGCVPAPPRGRPQAERVLLEAVYPDGTDAAPDQARLALLAPHVTALSGTDPGAYRPDLAELFAQTALYLRGQGQTVQALPVLRAYSRQVVAGFGPDHRTALTGCNAFASALAAAGKPGDAVEILEELRERSIRVLGPDALTTLNIRANLASAYHDSGRLDSAVEEFIDATAVAAEHLGPEHARTLTLRNGLARAYEDIGRYEQAIEIYKDLLRHEERLARQEHESTPPTPNAAQVRNNLAGAYESVGQYEESVTHYRKALGELTRLLGPGHPTTVDCLGNLGYALESAGGIDEASNIYRDVLKRRVTTLGEDHPDTLLSQSNLANLHLTKGEVDTGLRLCRRTLVQREQTLGPTHVDTLVSRNMLASALESAGKLDQAANLYETTLGQRREVLGRRHPATLLTLANLAVCRLRSGNAAAAVPLLEEALAGQQQLSGQDSPDALRHLHNLAAAYRETGNLARAQELFTIALDRRTQVLGAKHFETLTTLSGLARLHQTEGNLDRAISLYEDAIAGLTETLGPDHPTTRAVSGYLAEARTP